MGPTHRLYTPEFNDIEEKNYMEENLNSFYIDYMLDGSILNMLAKQNVLFREFCLILLS